MVVQAEYGDCFLLQSSNGNDLFSVLIDGGPSQTYERNLKPTLDKVLSSKKLDLVILSHIDNDHVMGLLDLLEAIMKEREGNGGELIRIEGLWHNSFSDLLGTKEGDNFVQNLMSSNGFSFIKAEDFITKFSALGALKGVSEGRDLTKFAQNLSIPINSQFGGDPIVTEEDEKVINIKNLKFSILGPRQKNLDKLKRIWDDWESSHLPAKFTIDDDYKTLQALDSSITNLSSIIFLVESEGKKMLFTGDGLGSDIVESLSKRGLLDPRGKLHVDILKVPHHGSERNVSEQFFDTVTADVYVISANGRDENPSFLTLKWIIENGKKDHRKITIAATNKTENIEKAQSIYNSEKFQYSFVFLEPKADFLLLNTNE